MTSHAKPVTSGECHFIGHYDTSPWNASGRYLLVLQAPFMDRQPAPDDAATLGIIDLQNDNRWIPLDEVRAWCWQRGNWMQWLPDEPDRKIIYNQRDGDHFISVIRDIHSGETRTLPHPIYAVYGTQALGLNFSRLQRLRPGYGYVGVADAGENDPHPDDDGIYRMDLETGETRLLITYQQMRDFHPTDTMAQGHHWFNAIHFAPDGSNFVWLHRWQKSPTGRQDRLLVANADGSDIRIVADDDYVSHLDYFSPNQVVSWSRQHGRGDHYFRYHLDSDTVEIIGEDVFATDGHCSFSPDRKWMLTDTYPDADRMQTLILFELATGRRIDIGRFYAPPALTGPIRCDLHPRWRRDGKQICIDSAHTGERQVYLIDVD